MCSSEVECLQYIKEQQFQLFHQLFDQLETIKLDINKFNSYTIQSWLVVAALLILTIGVALAVVCLVRKGADERRDEHRQMLIPPESSLAPFEE